MKWFSVRFLAIFFWLSVFDQALAQSDIPLGTWRVHLSFNEVNSIAFGNEEVFAAGRNGVLVFNRIDNSVSSRHKANGLSFASISCIGFDPATSQLIVAYDNGTFDVIKQNSIRNFDPSRNTVLTGGRKINDISIHKGLAYLSTEYGVLIFDLARAEIKETWRDLGPQGQRLIIFESTFLADSVFLATEKGILGGDLADNLLDFHKWKRFNSGELNSPINSIAVFDGKVHGAISGTGIFRYEGGTWNKEPFLQGVPITDMNSSYNVMLIAQPSVVALLDLNYTLTQVTHDSFQNIADAKMDEFGKLWIGDTASGLISDFTGAFNGIRPNGPSVNDIHSLAYFQNRMYAVAGGFSGNFLPKQRTGVIDYFEKGIWSSTTVPVDDITSLVFLPEGGMYVSSFGDGVLKSTVEGSTIFDETNSSLINTNPPQDFVTITDLELSADGLWVANYGAVPSLHLYTPEKNWESFSFPVPAAKFPTHLEVDHEGNVWMLLNPAHGGGILVFNKAQNEQYHLTDQDGQGELPSTSVGAIETDRDGYVWVGTSSGVAYFFDEQSDAVKPIFENRFLLRDDNVTAIAVDGGNRKWIGTERGVWLFDATGETALANFTAQNSPLLSDHIVDIEINSRTGEVFFATSNGLVSYRANATESKATFEKIKIFPNPVLNNFTGLVGISGLSSDSIVKITDVSGKLIWQTQANGGTASWNVADHQGRRVPTGVFLVFAITPDGAESMVGKIAVVN